MPAGARAPSRGVTRRVYASISAAVQRAIARALMCNAAATHMRARVAASVSNATVRSPRPASGSFWLPKRPREACSDRTRTSADNTSTHCEGAVAAAIAHAQRREALTSALRLLLTFRGPHPPGSWGSQLLPQQEALQRPLQQEDLRRRPQQIPNTKHTAGGLAAAVAKSGLLQV